MAILLTLSLVQFLIFQLTYMILGETLFLMKTLSLIFLEMEIKSLNQMGGDLNLHFHQVAIQ